MGRVPSFASSKTLGPTLDTRWFICKQNCFTNDAAGEKKIMFTMRWRTQNKIGLLEPLQAFFDNLL